MREEKKMEKEKSKWKDRERDKRKNKWIGTEGTGIGKRTGKWKGAGKLKEQLRQVIKGKGRKPKERRKLWRRVGCVKER